MHMNKKYDLNIRNIEKIIGNQISYTNLTFIGVSYMKVKGCYTLIYSDDKGDIGYVYIYRTISIGWSERYDISANNEIYDRISKTDMVRPGDLCGAVGFIFLDYFKDKYK